MRSTLIRRGLAAVLALVIGIGVMSGVASATNGDKDGSDLGKLTVFSGVREFPVRVKCATLPWHTLKAALAGAQETVSTELTEGPKAESGGAS